MTLTIVSCRSEVTFSTTYRWWPLTLKDLSALRVVGLSHDWIYNLPLMAVYYQRGITTAVMEQKARLLAQGSPAF